MAGPQRTTEGTTPEPTAALSHHTLHASPRGGGGRRTRSRKLHNSHGPDIDFGAVFLPGKKLRRGVGGAAALRAERVRVAQDPRTVAQTKVCKEGRTKPAPN